MADYLVKDALTHGDPRAAVALRRPIYRNMITTTLRTTDRRSYHAAARLLQSLKRASIAAEDQQGFDDFLRSPSMRIAADPAA